MVPLRFHRDEFEAVCNAPSDPLAAGQCLATFAARLRKEMVLGDSLADHVARAFELAAAAPASRRAKTLTDALYLTAPRKRAAGNWSAIGFRIESLIGDGTAGSEATAIETAAHEADVDPSTARRYLKKWRAAQAEHGAIE